MDALCAGRRPILLLTLLCALLYLPGQATLPPFDRDEARFAQASKQVLTEGRWIVPYFQDAPRSKKPAGIYWLQAGSVAAVGALTEPAEARRSIWGYRIPSVIGAWLSVLLTYALGCLLFDRRAALVGAALLGGSLLLTVEAHLAKTDAVLLATILLALWGMARAQALWRAGGVPDQSGRAPWLAFWGGLGVSTLIKGPIGPVVVLLAFLAQAAVSRALRWARFLRPRRGLLLFLVLAGAWPLALVLTGAGGFIAESANEDLIPKLLSAQESHGAPPGSYLLALYVTFWPAVLLVVPAFVWAWGRLSHPGVRFCLAWIVPGWILFALVPTKLPHYVLPFYPALALLGGALVTQGWAELRHWSVKLLLGLHGLLWALVGLGLAAAAAVLPAVYASQWTPWAALLTLLALAGVALVGWRVWRLLALRRVRWFGLAELPIPAQRQAPGLAGALVLAALLVWPVLAHLYVPRLDHLFVARTVAAHLPAPEARPPLAATGYREPSLVFLNGTETVLTTPEGVAAHMAATPGSYGLIEEAGRTAFQVARTQRGFAVEPVASFDGFNYSKGDWRRFHLLKRVPRDAE
jgi:4-amino-4-deoxy-L-arabinose transferase-like glycosyltransferase